MPIIHRRITVVQIRHSAKKDINSEIRYLANSLGLIGPRDKDNSCFRVFIELLKATRRNFALSSDELAARTKLSRGTVVHHLSKLIETGLVINEHNRYLLRAGNLSAVIEEIQKDINRSLNDLKSVANVIDENLGL